MLEVGFGIAYRSGKNTAKTALKDFICVIDVSIAFEAIYKK
jgi:hypothetical protein